MGDGNGKRSVGVAAQKLLGIMQEGTEGIDIGLGIKLDLRESSG